MATTITSPPVNGSAGTPSYSLGSVAHFAAPATRTRRVAILGFSETVKDAPVNDPTWELWAMNGFWRAAKPDFGIDIPEDRYSLWLDMHTVDYTRAYGERAGFGDAQEKWLEKEHPFPILMLDADPRFPSVRSYPIEDVMAANGADYFTSTVAYALALALSLSDVAEIGLWGIDLVHDSEYADQRPCAEFYLGRASALGIKLTIHERSALLRQRARYGYESEPPLFLDMVKGLEDQRASLQKRLAALHADNDRIVGEMQSNDGALQLVNTLLGRLAMWQRGGRI